MAETAEPPRIGRVLVALDDPSYGRDALEAAASLAAELQAELQGLFIEDVDALRAAGLPFVREIATASATARPINPRTMERALRDKAEIVRQLMATVADRVQIRWSFSVTRGRVTQRALAAASETDVVFLGPRGYAPTFDCSMTARHGTCTRPVLAVYDGSTTGRRTLRTAATIARHLDCRIVVLLYSSDPDDQRKLGIEAAEQLLRVGVAAAVVAVTSDSMIQTARNHEPYLLLISRASRLLHDTTLETLVDNLNCPVTLV